jgi:TP901 family phage tail tape measure protein
MRAATASVTASTKQMSESFNGLSSVIEEIGTKLTAALVIEKLVEIGRQLAETFDQVAKKAEAVVNASLSFGITTKELQGVQAIAARTGSSTEALQTAFQRLDREIVQAAEGNKQMQERLESVGISLKNIQDPAFTVLDAFVKIGQSGASNAEIMSLLGRNSADLIPTIHELAGGLAAVKEAAESVGSATKAQLDQLKESAEKVSTLELKWQNFKTTLAASVSPELNKLLDVLSQILDKIRDAGGYLEYLRQKFAALPPVIQEVVQRLVGVVPGIGAMINNVLDTPSSSSGPHAQHPMAPEEEQRPAPGRAITNLKPDRSMEDVWQELSDKIQHMLQRAGDEGYKDIISSAANSAKAQEELQTGEIDREIQGVQEAYRTRQISAKEELQDTLDLLAKKLAAQTNYFNMLESLYADDQKKLAEIQAQEASARNRILGQQQSAEAAYSRNVLQNWQTVTRGLQSALTSSLEGMLRGTMSFAQAMGNLFMGVFDAIISKLAQFAADWISKLILTKVVNQASALSEISANAGVAATAAMASVAAIPVYGWALAPEVGASTFAEAMTFAGAASAFHGFDIPPNLNPITQLHGGEMVLPRKYADMFREMESSPGGRRGGGDTHVHLHTLDTSTVDQALRNRTGTLAKALRDHARARR